MVASLETSATVPAPTAKSLGAARARNGVSITETMTDFRALFTAAGETVDVEALQSLAEGWAEAMETAPPLSCTDVYTGLATQAHFRRRIHEISTSGSERPGTLVLAIISIASPHNSQNHCWTLLARIGEAVNGQLDGTGAMAMYQNSAIHVLFPLSQSNISRVIGCKIAVEALGDGALSPARTKFYPLPSAAAATASAPHDSSSATN
ncbi:hypothetical protein SAMN04487917_108171 [Arthrobacter sp. yr096]|nr:hypothetical protein SAMN04487912_107147 [Arthrobacter sp. cf158]SEJ64213.1 hypothetical protein SAMN04487917_108171 [Arthrobacter sp. yr096]